MPNSYPKKNNLSMSKHMLLQEYSYCCAIQSLISEEKVGNGRTVIGSRGLRNKTLYDLKL